jgi:two-component system LytT family response regulator
MIRAFVVEDEQPALERLTGFLENIPDIEIAGTSASGKEAVERIDALEPDLVFLDIHLPDISGIDMLHLLSHEPEIIFTTAYDQYAIKAFELRAVDYLLKPFSEERFKEAVDRVRDKIKAQEGEASGIEDIRQLFSSWNPQQQYLKRIPSKIGDKIYILPDENIVYFASENKLVFAFLTDSKYMLNYTLEELQARLDPEQFFRIHRSTIVNLNYVKTIEPWFGGGYKMTVNDKKRTELTISRQAGKQLRKKLGW